MTKCFECGNRIKADEDIHVVVLPDGKARKYCSQNCRDKGEDPERREK